MIIGIGCDIVEIPRIQKLMADESFLKRCFTDNEQAYIKKNAGSAAACFAAKEAYSKALGTGIRGFSLKDIEIFHDSLNKPYIRAYHGAACRENLKTFLTLSHSRDTAVAFVVIEDTERGS